ncbi:MAG: hypothetical protein KA807_05105 [Prolixibacteraceae bacterium]|nr:hypothetical protein [Prolixibacteraceae bacterium]
MKKFISLIIITINSLNTFPNDFYFSKGSDATGMGNAYISRTGLSSAFHNQAGLTEINSIQFLVNCENRFLLKDVNSLNLLMALPATTGNFAMHTDFTGNIQNYNSRIGVAYSKKLTKKLYSGLQMNFLLSCYSENNKNYSWETGLELGFIYQFSELTSCGIHVSNPYNLRLSKNNNNPVESICIRGGFHTKYSEYFIVALEAEYKNNTKLNLKAGIESEVRGELTIRGGINTYPFSLYGGIGLKRSAYKLDISLAYYPVPGLCPSLTLIFSK